MAASEKIKNWLGNLQQSIFSVIKIALKSRRSSPLPTGFRNPDELVILANGPSLNGTVTANAGFLSDKTLMAVNFCATSPMFEQLRPQIYIIADPLFWIVDEKRQQLFGALAEKTVWPLHLFIPARARIDKEWQKIIAGNRNIHIVIYNTTPVEGFGCFARAVYARGLGMPRPHNVLIPAITEALRMPFKKIYLAGADHSWLPEISVTDDNQVLMHQKHFYDRGTSKAETVKQEDLNPAHLHTILYHMHVAFKSYFTLRDFAERRQQQIINITPGSFIDAFTRMKLPQNTSDKQ